MKLLLVIATAGKKTNSLVKWQRISIIFVSYFKINCSFEITLIIMSLDWQEHWLLLFCCFYIRYFPFCSKSFKIFSRAVVGSLNYEKLSLLFWMRRGSESMPVIFCNRSANCWRLSNFNFIESQWLFFVLPRSFFLERKNSWRIQSGVGHQPLRSFSPHQSLDGQNESSVEETTS